MPPRVPNYRPACPGRQGDRNSRRNSPLRCTTRCATLPLLFSVSETLPGFLLYCLTVLIFSLVMIYYVSPRYGTRNPLIYVSICSMVGSISIMAVKGFGVALKLTLAGKNQLTHPSTYVFAIVVVVCILVQMNYFNKALDTFSTNVYV